MFEHSPEQMQEFATEAATKLRALAAVRDDTAKPAYLRAIAQQHLDVLALIAKDLTRCDLRGV